MNARTCPSCKKNKVVHQQRSYQKKPALPCIFTLEEMKAIYDKVMANPKEVRDVQLIKSAFNTYKNNCNSLANDVKKLSERYI